MPPTPPTTEAFQATCDRLFAPFLRPPRNPTFPTPPSLAASRLPPPAAEIDERPSYRVRRFRLWKENAPALRMAVLDPKRRIQLWRYQSFAIPNVPFPRRGNLAFKWTPPPRPPSVTTQPVQATIPAAPGLPEQTPSTSPSGQIAQPNLAPTQTQLTLAPIQTQPNVTPMRTQPNLPLTQKPQTPSPKIKKTKAERRVLWKRMLQNKYALDQEHERRFRGAMAVLTDNVVGFERKNVGTGGSGTFREDVDLELVKGLSQSFKAIRRKSRNVFMLDNSAIRPVPGRGEAHRAVRDEETRKKKKREAKEAKKRAVEERAVDLLTLAPPIRGDVTPQETSGLVVPVTAGQWMSVPNSDPPLSPSSSSTALSTPVSSSHTEAQALPATTKPPPTLDSAELKSKTGAEKDEKTNVPHDISEQWQHLDHKLYDDLAKQLAAMLIQANSVSSPGTGQDKGKNEEKAIDIALEVPGDHEAVKLTLADLLADSNDLEKNENVEEKVSLLESERQEGNLVVEEYKDGSAEEPAPVESPEADRVQALGNEIDIAGKSDRGLELEYEIAHLRSKLLKRARASKVPRGDLYMDSDTAHPEKSAFPDDTPSLVSERGNGSDSVSTCREPADSLFGEESIQDDVDTADTAIGEKMDAEVTGGRGGFARVISLVS